MTTLYVRFTLLSGRVIETVTDDYGSAGELESRIVRTMNERPDKAFMWSTSTTRHVFPVAQIESVFIEIREP